MSTENELATFQYCKDAYACFTIPNKPRKFVYGQLLHNITWLEAENHGSFLMENSTVSTVDIKIVDAAVTFLKSVNTLVDEAIQKARILDSQQPLTASQISAFESQRDSYRTLFNNNWKSVYLPQIKSLDDAKYDSIRENITSTVAIVYRLVNLISSISIAQKQQIEQWKINANTNT